jgi:UDPglucose 6-dehydrogenase
MLVTVIGRGFVGKATMLLENPDVTVWVYDIVPEYCVPEGLTYEDVNEHSDLIFVCVPTPMRIDGSCNTGILESVLGKLDHPYVVVRSTVPPGFCASHDCFFMPEFLTEKNWAADFKACPVWIVGLVSPDQENNRSTELEKKIRYVLTTAKEGGHILHDETFFCPSIDAELIKLVRNNYLSTKLIFFNDIFKLCNTIGASYENVRHGVAVDTKIGPSHTLVDGNAFHGYGGTCFPKDTNSLFHIFQDHHLESALLEANLYTNEYLLNPDKKWLSMYDRAVTGYTGRVLVYALLDATHEPLVRHILDQEQDCVVIGIQVPSDCNTPLVMDHPRLYLHRYNLSHKLFLPRCDEIQCLVGRDLETTVKMESLLHLRQFSKTYRVPLAVHVEDSERDAYLLEWMNTEWSS